MEIIHNEFVTAAELGDIDLVRLMIQQRKEVVLERIDGGMTALHRAAQFGHVEVVRELLIAGISPSVRDTRRRTPLHSAAAGEHSLFCMHLLLAAGCPVDAKNIYGDTALMVAITNSNVSSVALLLIHGADPSEKNRRKLDPLGNVEFQREGLRQHDESVYEHQIRDLVDIRYFLEDFIARRN